MYYGEVVLQSEKETGVDPKAIKTIYAASCTFLQLIFSPPSLWQ